MSTQFTNRQWRLPNNENKAKQSNYSMDFDGSSQYIDCGESVLHTSNATVFTLSAWIKPKAGMSLGIIAADAPAASPTNGGFWIGYDNRNTATRPANGISYNIKTSTGYQSGKSNDNVITLNVWNHIVLVLDGQATLYVNGVSSTNRLSDNIGDLVTQSHELLLGTEDTLSFEFNGQIDGVSIFNYALTDGTGGTVNQIAALYGSSSTGIGNPMSLSPKPVAYYPLGDQDAFNGANYLVPNSSLKDYVFDFIPNDYINVSSNTGLNFGTGDFTYSLWGKTNSTSGNPAFYGGGSGNNNPSSNTGYLSVGVHTSQPIGYVGATRCWISGEVFNGTTIITDDNWHNIVLTRTSGVVQIYVDGNIEVMRDSSGNVVSNPTSSNSITNTNGITIGGFYTSGSFINGSMSNAQIFNTALPATGSNSVETLYNNGSPLTSMSGFTSLQGWWKLDASATYDGSNWTIPDDSSNSNDGTSSGMTQSALQQSDLSFKTSISPFALNFDGTYDYIDLGNLTGVETNQFSISMWAKVTATNRILFNSGLAYPNGMLIQYVGTYFFISVGGSGAASTTITLNTTKWYNILLSVNGTTLKLYIDGSQLGSDLTIGSGRTGIGSDAVLARYKYSTSYYVKGSISNASIWNTALTSSQVTELYNEGVPSNLNNHSAYSNLVNWWQLGSNSSFNSTLNQWTCIDEKGTNTGESSQTFNEDAIVDGVGSYANGLSSGMGGDEVIGDAPYSTANSLSVNMDVLDRVTDTPS